ncbi:MAG: hypothetical protein II528_08340, partial [Lachnospiraceae bacterium]|nr:hypothetical protein [Lachnospiraceae bacterium]
MKKNLIIRLLGLTLSVVIATSNMTSVVYAAEPEIIETTEDVVEEEPEEVIEEEVEETEETEEDMPLAITTFNSEDEVSAYLSSHPSNGMRLLVFSDTALENYFGASEVATYGGLWMLTYEDGNIASDALRAFSEAGFATDMDNTVEGHEEEQLTEEVEEELLPEESVEAISEATQEENTEVVPEEKEVV